MNGLADFMMHAVEHPRRGMPSAGCVRACRLARFSIAPEFLDTGRTDPLDPDQL